MNEYDIDLGNRYNTDEKGFLQGCIKEAKHVVPLSMLQQGRIRGAAQTGDRTWISIIATICADGIYLPPAIIYKGGGNLSTAWLMDFKPDKHKAFYTSTESGFSNKDLAFDWLVNVFD